MNFLSQQTQLTDPLIQKMSNKMKILPETSICQNAREDVSDGEICDEDGQNGESETDENGVDLTEKMTSKNGLRDKSRVEQIKRIDAEMLEKIRELHGIMSGEGMSESAAMLDPKSHFVQNRWFKWN